MVFLHPRRLSSWSAARQAGGQKASLRICSPPPENRQRPPSRAHKKGKGQEEGEPRGSREGNGVPPPGHLDNPSGDSISVLKSSL